MLSTTEAQDAIIVALDCSKERAYELAEMLAPAGLQWVKIGMTLYYAEGPEIVKHMKDLGLKVFLDLKLHDIPFQIKGAAASAARSGADIISIHGLGGKEMIAEGHAGCVEVGNELGIKPPDLIAISVLTSMTQETLSDIGIELPLKEEVAKLAKLAYSAGAQGIVCSPQEAHEMRELLGSEALIVTPGVRPQGSALGDQKRVATPLAAIEAGASKLVIGRPITGAENPAQVFSSIRAELTGTEA